MSYNQMHWLEGYAQINQIKAAGELWDPIIKAITPPDDLSQVLLLAQYSNNINRVEYMKLCSQKNLLVKSCIIMLE